MVQVPIGQLAPRDLEVPRLDGAVAGYTLAAEEVAKQAKGQ